MPRLRFELNLTNTSWKTYDDRMFDTVYVRGSWDNFARISCNEIAKNVFERTIDLYNVQIRPVTPELSFTIQPVIKCSFATVPTGSRWDLPVMVVRAV